MTILIWELIFILWFLWELALRVLLNHRTWTFSQILSFTSTNLLFAICSAFVLGLIYTFFLFLIDKRKNRPRFRPIFSPVGIAFIPLVALMLLVPYRSFAFRHDLPGWLWWITAIAIILVVALACVFAASRIKLPRRLVITLFLIPIFILLAVPLLTRNEIKQVAKGPVRYVVLISIDTLRHDYVGAYGAKNVRTPVMDQIASEGALFREAIASVPLTGPSHASMLTGQPPLMHGVHLNGQPLSPKVSTIATHLRDAGFQTAGFVSGFPMKAVLSGLDQGFQLYEDRFVFTDSFNETFFGRWADNIPVLPRGLLRLANEVTDSALEWLNKRNDSTFFLFLHYYDPHFPYGTKARTRYTRNALYGTAKPEDLENQKRLYASEVETVDKQIGRVVELLKKKKIYDETLLIITADHGESLGEHDYYYDHEYYVYEPLVRVPLLVRHPTLLPSGTVVEQQVAVLDIGKTILEAVGLRPMKTTGYNLIHVANHSVQGYDRSILAHNFHHKRNAIRTQGWKLILTGRDSVELYDLSKDPAENDNLFLQNQSKATELQNKLTGMLQFGDLQDVNWNKENLSAEQIENLKSLGYVQ
jgi:arylsulfatase A-like enzyme